MVITVYFYAIIMTEDQTGERSVRAKINEFCCCPAIKRKNRGVRGQSHDEKDFIIIISTLKGKTNEIKKGLEKQNAVIP